MSATGKLYVGKKEKGKLQHSSFLAGGATTAAGRLLVKDGTIEVMEAHSGHYHPTQENFDELVTILRSRGADLTFAKVQAFSDDMLSKKSNSAKSLGAKSEISLLDFPVVSEDLQKVDTDNNDASILELASLSLNDEESLPKKAQEKGDAVIEGLEFLQTATSCDGTFRLENLEGMKVEIIKPGMTSELKDQTTDEREVKKSVNSSSKVLSFPVSSHQLFAPASQTFSKLEDRADSCSADRQDAKTENTAQLTPDSKVYLSRRLSFHAPVVAPS